MSELPELYELKDESKQSKVNTYFAKLVPAAWACYFLLQPYATHALLGRNVFSPYHLAPRIIP
jgi:hypothetical protein